MKKKILLGTITFVLSLVLLNVVLARYDEPKVSQPEREEVTDSSFVLYSRPSNEPWITDEPVALEPEMETPVPKEPTPEYTEEEVEILAIIIYQEAGGDACSDDTRRHVGTVFMNRVESDDFPDTIYEVATQKGQYGRLYWTGIQWPERSSNPGEAHAVQRAWDTAREILGGVRTLPSYVIFQSEYENGTVTYLYQDGMYFCY